MFTSCRAERYTFQWCYEYHHNHPSGREEANGSYIDVGQADSILIQTPGGKNVLIDAGNNDDASTIVTYLKAQNISRLDYVIATHSHEDHIGSLDTVIKTFDIGQVVMPKESSNTQTFRDVLTAIANKVPRQLGTEKTY